MRLLSVFLCFNYWQISNSLDPSENSVINFDLTKFIGKQNIFQMFKRILDRGGSADKKYFTIGRTVGGQISCRQTESVGDTIQCEMFDTQLHSEKNLLYLVP